MALFTAILPRTAGVKSPSCLSNGAWLHASSVCQEKWECKWRNVASRYKFSDSNRKEYLNYIKRKKRSDLKRDLLGWRSMEISFNNIHEIFGSCSSERFSKARKKMENGRREKQSGQFSSEYRTEGTSTKKGNAKSQGKENKDQSFTRPGKDDHFFFYKYERRARQQWCHFWSEAFWWETSRDSWEESSHWKQRTERKKAEKAEATIGSASDRKALGLSPTGPLSLEELKKAFRAAALKWHPDRHDGASKGIAEEKFKVCGAAYKSLLTVVNSE